VDHGSHLLIKTIKAAIKDTTLGKARVIKQRCRYISSSSKTKVSNLLEEKIFKEAFHSLYVTQELNLQSMSVSKIQ